MKTIGVLGGMSSVASAEYYRLLNEGVNARLGGYASAELLLYNVDFAVIEACIKDEHYDLAADYLAERARRLERGGAEFLVLATNTLHRVAADIEAAVEIPFVHIVDVTADAASGAGVDRLGLLGTGPVMQAEFYRSRFAEHGIEVLAPSQGDQAVVHRVIFEELTHGRLEDDSRAQYLRIMRELVAGGAQGIVLGCTEISLLVSPADIPEIQLFDTTALHVDRAVELSLGIRPLPSRAATGRLRSRPPVCPIS